VKRFMLVMLLLGGVLTGVIVYQTNLSEVWARLRALGVWGFALVLSVYIVCSVAQAVSWLLTMHATPPTPRWLYRLWKVLMVGFALERSTPLAGLGGEPAKAVLLKRHYGLRIRDASASLVLTRTTDLIAQVLFITIGTVLMFRSEALPEPYRFAAGGGLALFSVCILLFFLAQKGGAVSRVQAWLERGWLRERSLSERTVRALGALQDLDQRLVSYYTAERGRFSLSVGAAFAEWMLGAVAVDLALDFLGRPVPFADAVVIESFLVLVRSTLFFVPADLGTQEGALVLICGAVAGSPASGLALSAIRRARDLLFMLWGLAIGSAYSLSAETSPAPAAGREAR
jgi:uncharacterized protein (TIRG00374 family)